jgi:flavin-dependent thymidylate synthase
VTVYLAQKILQQDIDSGTFNLMMGAPLTEEQRGIIGKEVSALLNGKTDLGIALEALTMVFVVENVSRACTHQLVRGRVGWGFLHRSSRVHDETNWNYRVPETIAQNPELLKEYENVHHTAETFYRKALAEGVPLQDARFAQPSGFADTITCIVNMRALIAFCENRLSNWMQWEINFVARRMREEVARVLGPEWALPLQPRCVKVGRCLNYGGIFPPCGRMEWSEEQDKAKYWFTHDQNANQQFVEEDRKELLMRGVKGVHKGLPAIPWKWVGNKPWDADEVMGE